MSVATCARWSAVGVLLGALSAQAEGLRRFAVIVGNDDGGADTRPLVYAREDARKIHGILTRLGGVREEDATLVLNKTADQFLKTLAGTERKVAEARAKGERTALFVYYSGHAKDGSLRLGNTRVPFESLKERLAKAPADVRVAVFDACRSGAMTRTKGARHAPAFEIESDAARQAKGLVILTSSAADEDSQESDEIGGSYFSHHLASGLLGGADRSSDGRVTLHEAYAYAYERTVADTSESAAGPMHPTFSYDLAGNGDFVLTELDTRKEAVLFPADAPGGVYYLVDENGLIAAEVFKAPDVERRVVLAAGRYRVKRRLPEKLRIGAVDVRPGQRAIVNEGGFKDAPFSDDPVKGARRDLQLPARMSLLLLGTFQSFLDATTRSTLIPQMALAGAELQIHNLLRRDWIWSVDVSMGQTRSVLKLSSLDAGSYRFSQLGVGTTLVARWPLGAVVPFAGGRLALMIMNREFDDAAQPKQYMSTLTPGIVGGAEYHFARRWFVAGRGRVHYVLYNIDENRSLGYWELSAMVAHDL